ncbi:hypothetical protein BJ875DRAFT_503499 [Amylocarpus encephaloides]|uniref:C2H2-type domain-containing protein n=1 Tax=Amylocarpus encephaloides TaxID=45428 RepID=A0A9P7YMA8_9HELO|nr:hypothetical protein BJ875DRAFT_503499 [Amylocarpus encephaloides]
MDDVSDSTSESGTDNLFDSSDDDKTDTTSDVDSESPLEEFDNNADDNDDDDLFDGEVRHPPEYYLATSSNLDIGRLRQKRYSPKTKGRLDWVKDHHDQYCTFIRQDPMRCFQDVSVNFLYGFLCWTFWKWYLIVHRLETGKKIDGMVQVQGQDVLKVITKEKGLDNTKRESATMYVEDLAEFARLILFCQLTDITSNRPEALVQLRYRHLKLTLIRDHTSPRPRLFIKLIAEFTKGFLGMKDVNEFKIPEIIYDPTLVLSPYTFLLGILFKVQAFKSPSIVSPKKLYSLNTACGVTLARQLQLSSDLVRYRMKIGGQITGFTAAKALNESPDVSDLIQNLILQYSSIDTFLKHYLDRNINVNRDLMRFTCLISRSIDPRRPRKLTIEQSTSVNRLLYIIKLDRRIARLLRVRGDFKGEEKYQKSLSGKVVDEDTRDVLERSGQLTPEHLLLIDAILTLPETSLKNESRRRITVINAITVYCGRGRTVKIDGPLVIKAKEPDPLSEAIRSIKREERPTKCFVCLGNPSLPLRKRVASYATPGSLSRHFLRKHVSKLQGGGSIDCQICKVRLANRVELLVHAEKFHDFKSILNTYHLPQCNNSNCNGGKRILILLPPADEESIREYNQNN